MNQPTFNEEEIKQTLHEVQQEESSVKTVLVDIFEIPETQVETYRMNREEVALAAAAVMKSYCVSVKRETLDPEEGEAVVGYYVNGEILMVVILDPFEVPVMKIALDNGKLKEYILAANELTENMLASISTK